ncbi:rhodanese-like domain-containing protein [Rubrolithibacter danxiaensis]|uniref:rhodanese-like domain-containing protein n=1 Tax=Rubrolithibacter danxiaensis TaxID=3390805 RepID=UPI003BF8CF96
MKKITKLLLILLISGSAFAQQKETVKVSEFKKGIKKEQALVLDVRTPEEYATGHIRGAVNIDWKNAEEFKAKANELQKTQPVYVYCRSGARSEKASNWLSTNGFTNVTDLEGGIEAWKKAGKRVSKK